jgi:hypothetical protein
MKVADFWDRYKDLTATISNNFRQLVFAGFAVVWIYNDNKIVTFHIAAPLLLATALFMIAIILDYLQYLYSAALCYLVARWRESKKIIEDVIFSDVFWFPSEMCFALKIIALTLGYVCLFIYIYNS